MYTSLYSQQNQLGGFKGYNIINYYLVHIYMLL